MSQLIKCPKCNTKSWSCDYWYCPTCSFSEVKEEALLEMCSEFKESYSRGDNPTILLNDWMKEQEDLTKKMVDECLPYSQNNYEVYCNEVLPSYLWGATAYHETEMKERIDFIIRNADSLTDKGEQGRHWKWHQYPNGLMVKLPLYPYINNSGKTEIYINKLKMTEEGSYGFDADGYFPTVPHETAHADPTVKRDPNFKWWQGGRKKNTGYGHDPLWKSKAHEFHRKLVGLGYVKTVKDRFKELRKIQGKDNDRYE